MSSKNKLDCSRNIMNYSKINKTDRFDKPSYDKKQFLDNLSIHSPKMIALLDNISNLDKKDRKLHKHFIFSNLKSGVGAKIIASAFVAAGYDLVMTNDRSKIVIDQEKLKKKSTNKFAVLSSTALWNNPVNGKLTKEILSIFNDRTKNIYGEQIRFIILDSGFKEGVDLFDVKYAHIFEDQVNEADLIQAVGRGTRFCGQKGLKFKNGWDLNVFNYKSIYYETDIPKNLLDELKKENKQMEFNINFQQDLSQLIKSGAVDKLLTEEINKLSKKNQSKKIIVKETEIQNALNKIKRNA